MKKRSLTDEEIKELAKTDPVKALEQLIIKRLDFSKPEFYIDGKRIF